MAFDGPKRTVIDGPFAETKELVAGYWLWEVKDLAEAVEWVKRCPNPMPGPSEIEIRPIFEAEDFGAEFTPELREQEERLRAQMGTRPSGRPSSGAARRGPGARPLCPPLVFRGEEHPRFALYFESGRGFTPGLLRTSGN